MENTRIVIVENEKIIAMDIKSRLQALGYEVLGTFSTGEEAIRANEELNPGLILMDIMLDGEMDGVAAAAAISDLSDTPIIFVTAYADGLTLQRAKVVEPYGYLLKPFEEKELFTTIETALYKHKMQKQLKESQQRFSATLRSIGDAVIATDENGMVTFINPVAETLCGLDANRAIGRHLSQVCRFSEEAKTKELFDVFALVRDTASSVVLRNKILLLSAEVYLPVAGTMTPIIDDRGRLLGYVLAFRDISELRAIHTQLEQSYENLKNTQQQLIQSSKMMAMGQLAAGITHELNQPLTGIKGFAQAALMEIEDAHPLRPDLARILEQAERMEKIISSIRFFARKAESVPKPMSINKPIEDALFLLGDQLKLSNIDVVLDLGDNLPVVHGDGNQLEQVMINLITNARDAITARNKEKGGDIRITTKLNEDGSAVMITVRDSGCGLTPDQRAHLFQPFFSTKSGQGGMGLGLSIVDRIIGDHGGSIKVDSLADEWTEITILLPLKPAAVLDAEG